MANTTKVMAVLAALIEGGIFKQAVNLLEILMEPMEGDDGTSMFYVEALGIMLAEVVDISLSLRKVSARLKAFDEGARFKMEQLEEGLKEVRELSGEARDIAADTRQMLYDYGKLVRSRQERLHRLQETGKLAAGALLIGTVLLLYWTYQLKTTTRIIDIRTKHLCKRALEDDGPAIDMFRALNRKMDELGELVERNNRNIKAHDGRVVNSFNDFIRKMDDVKIRMETAPSVH